MQASTSPNEKPLPRQILRRSAAVQAHLDARKAEQKTDPAVPNVQPAPGTNGTATAVEPNPNPTPTPPVDPRENDPDYWRQRAKVAEGRLRIQKEEHQATVGGMTQRISELQDQVRTLEANAPVAPIDVSEFLTPEQVELLGKDEAQLIVDTVLKGAQQQVAKLVEKEIKPLRDAQATRQADTMEDTKRQFLDALVQQVPDYAEIDVSQEWLDWLAEEDDSTGLPRQNAMDFHISRANAGGVAKMFKAFKATRPKQPIPPVAPNGSGAGPSGNAPAVPNAGLTAPSPAEIKDFFKRKSTLRKGQPGYVTDQEALTFEKRMKLRARQQ